MTTSSTKPSSATTNMLASIASVMVQWLWYGIPINATSHHNAPFNIFCQDILAATSLSSSVVLLALRYIKTLKQANPNIKGAAGSEYRLFTAALMLANKYLEDSAYTNATFAELSKIPINEINQMEMEFLAVLDYSLYVSETSYLQWLRECEMFLSSQGLYSSLPVLRPIKTPTGARRPSVASLMPTAATKTSSATLAYVPAVLPSVSFHKRPASEVFGSQPVVATQYKRASVYGLHTPPSQLSVSIPAVIAPVPTYPPTPNSATLPYASAHHRQQQQQQQQQQQPSHSTSFLSFPIDFLSQPEVMYPRSLYYYTTSAARQVASSVSNRLQYIPTEMNFQFPTTMA